MGYAAMVFDGSAAPGTRGNMTRKFTVVIERDEDGVLVGTVLGLQGCHTQAHSLDELLERVREAIELCLEVQGEQPGPSLELVGFQSVAV